MFWGNEKNPGAIAHELSLLSIEPGIKPITTVDGADRTQVTSSLKLFIATGRYRDKAQAMHLLWGVDRGKYNPLMDKLRSYFPKGNNNYSTIVSEAYILLLHYSNDATYYIENIKDVDIYSFSTDGEVEGRKNKTPLGGKKGGGSHGGNSNGGTGGDTEISVPYSE